MVAFQGVYYFSSLRWKRTLTTFPLRLPSPRKLLFHVPLAPVVYFPLALLGGGCSFGQLRPCVWFPLGACVRYEPRPNRHVGDVSSRGCDQGFLSLSFHPEIRNRFNKGTDSTGRAGLGDRLPAEGLRNSSFLSSIALLGLTRVTAAVGTDMRVKTEMI